MIIDTSLYSNYIVTGLLYNSNKRFRRSVNLAAFALSINLWRGSVWGVRKDNGKKKLLKRVYN